MLALLPFVVIDGPAAGWLRGLGLLDRDEQFTELFFPDRQALPTTVTAGSPISFRFSLHNREGKTVAYRWKAVVVAGGTDIELARGRSRLDDGEVLRIPVVGPAPDPVGPAVVRVTLVARDEAIDFRLTIVALADVAPAPPR